MKPIIITEARTKREVYINPAFIVSIIAYPVPDEDNALTFISLAFDNWNYKAIEPIEHIKKRLLFSQ
jgi:hypothetical protein